MSWGIYRTLKKQYDAVGNVTGRRWVVLGWARDDDGKLYITTRVIRLHGERAAKRLVREYLDEKVAA